MVISGRGADPHDITSSVFIYFGKRFILGEGGVFMLSKSFVLCLFVFKDFALFKV